MFFFPGDKPTLCFSNITLVAICAFDFIHCALAIFGVNHVLVGRKQITNLLGGFENSLDSMKMIMLNENLSNHILLTRKIIV